jgi:hypothetical protein
VGKRGPKAARAQDIYFFANEFYWEFRAIAEGTSRWTVDRLRFEKSVLNIQDLQLSGEKNAEIAQTVDEEIRTGTLDAAGQANRVQILKQDHLFMSRENARFAAVEDTRRQVKVPGEPDVVHKLLSAKSATQIRQICSDAFTFVNFEVEPGVSRQVRVANWPIPSGSMMPEYLSRYADQVIAAIEDSRFPRSKRPTNELKQLWFLARALAGAVHGIQPRTAINLVGSTRPEALFEESRAAKSARKRRSR